MLGEGGDDSASLMQALIELTQSTSASRSSFYLVRQLTAV